MKTAIGVALLSAAGAIAIPEDFKPVSGPYHRNGGKFSAKRDSPWGGAVQEGNGWTYVVGTTKIPTITGQDEYAGTAAWVGIDGYRCSNAILQTGVQAHGDGTVRAWYEWWPEAPVYYDSKFPVKSGDVIRMSVNATSRNSGSSMLENLTTGKKIVTPYRNMRESLCLTDAEWILEYGGDSQSFADFGEWDFSDTKAIAGNKQVTATGSNIVNVRINGQTLTDCSTTNSGEVDCSYSG
ncbi:hypothetical protein PWT90_06998 [Aphanocladium album]|nr:hypothetical protein PWT90_06998 [Aphanocladium album]